MQVPVHVYASRRLEPPARLIADLKHIATLRVLTEAVVALPELHHKPQLECPSSIVTATNNHIVLGLTSPSPNCGIALARTALCADDVDGHTLDALFGELGTRLEPARQSPALSVNEVSDVLLSGAKAAVMRYGLPTCTVDYMDQCGNAFAGPPDVESILAAVPQPLLEIGAWEFGLIGRGNHFLELQVVDELYNSAVARAWKLSRKQIVVMYHADSGHLGAFVGRLYAHRRKNTWQGRVREWQVKLPFHLRLMPSERLLHRINYHLLPHRLKPIPVDCEEGQRTLMALQAASNYAFASRLAVLAVLRSAMRAIWGETCATPTLLWDAPHNSIRWEAIGGQDLWVHRHNAARVLPPSQLPASSPFAQTGHPVLLPGMNCTSSYLCVGAEGALHTLHSVNHGAGRSALLLGRYLNDGGSTRVYTHGNSPAIVRSHLSDDGLQEVMSILKSHDIAQPVARLRPLAVLKGSL